MKIDDIRGPILPTFYGNNNVQHLLNYLNDLQRAFDDKKLANFSETFLLNEVLGTNITVLTKKSLFSCKKSENKNEFSSGKVLFLFFSECTFMSLTIKNIHLS